MQIEHAHTLGQQAAIDRLEQTLGQLLQAVPGGVTIQNAVHQWTGGHMDFSFKAMKGFLGATIDGKADVTDDTVRLDFNLPPMVASFIGEDAIRQAVSKELGKILTATSFDI